MRILKSEEMIQTKNLTFSYSEVQKFNFPDISCPDGETLLITGNSGVGKTTLLHLLGGMLKPSSGDLIVNQQNLNLLSEAKLDAFRGKHIGIVLQKSFFIESLTILENVVMSSWLANGENTKNEAIALLERLGLKDHLHKLPSQISLGQQQRVSIARALINKPAVILADEPTSSLDDDNANKVAKMLSQLAIDFKASLIIVTHDQRLKNIYSNHIHLG